MSDDSEANYWSSRPSRTNWATQIKANVVVRELAGRLLSLRAADELFLSREIRRRRISSVLDIACGGGKAILGRLPFCAGVDIVGAPAEAARAKGYDEVCSYSPPDYEFSISRAVEALTCINLNAHIDLDALSCILDNARRYLAPGGILIMCNEYDNDGFTYRHMRRCDYQTWERMVSEMQHDFLGYERDLVRHIAGLGFKPTSRRPLIGGVVPALHAHWYLRKRDPATSIGTAALLAADVPLSLINTLQCKLAAPVDKAFLVGHVFEVN